MKEVDGMEHVPCRKITPNLDIIYFPRHWWWYNLPEKLRQVARDFALGMYREITVRVISEWDGHKDHVSLSIYTNEKRIYRDHVISCPSKSLLHHMAEAFVAKLENYGGVVVKDEEKEYGPRHVRTIVVRHPYYS